MIYIKTDEEIELIRLSSLLVGKTLAEVAKHIRAGITTLQLDTIAEAFIHDNGAKPGFKGYQGYPATLCVSVNEQVVHGIPGKTRLEDGDIVSIDCGVWHNGFYGDAAYTFAVGEVNPEVNKLLVTTKTALYEGIKYAIAGKRTGDIGNAIQTYAEQHGFSVIRELVGHGVGKSLHESPEVPNYGKRGNGALLSKGMVIAIEPMINLGSRYVLKENDGWTIRTADGKPSAHFEHTVAIRNDGADILSDFSEIEQVIWKN